METLTAAHAALLARVELFATLDRVALARLAACAEALRFDVDSVVCREGEPADGLYVVVRGTFGVFASDPTTQREGRINSLAPGDAFGELALLGDEPRSATVRAETGGEVLRLERERFLDLLRVEPRIGLAIATALGRRLRGRDHLHLDDYSATAARVDFALSSLPPRLHQQVLESSVVLEPRAVSLRAMFGADADEVRTVLESLGGERERVAVQAELRARLARSVGVSGVERIAEAASQRLLGAGHADEALRTLDSHGLRVAFCRALTRALPALVPAQAEHWLHRVGEEDAALEPALALAWSAAQERQGAHQRAVRVLRQALRATGDPAHANALRMALARTEGRRGGLVGQLSRRWRTTFALSIAGTFIFTAFAVRTSDQVFPFVLLLGGAIVLWIASIVPASAVALGLLAGWILSGVARADQALAGFATLDWLFVLAVFGLSAAAASSGLLFRVGLLLVKRLPEGLFWQSGSLLLTGILLTPLLPTATGRSAITEPLALAVADALHLRERQPASAVLGLAAWLGAGPLRFLFLNGSSVCLLAWGLLPSASRAHFDWITWFLAALPFGALTSLGGLLMLFLALRPQSTPPTERGVLDVQLTVLGPLSGREKAMLAVLLLTVGGWVAAPALHLDIGLIAVLGLLGAVVTGHFGRRALHSLDWDYLLFYGVALSLVRLSSQLGLDHVVGDVLASHLVDVAGNLVLIVIAVLLLSVLVCQLLGPDQSVLLLGLALVPPAARLGLEPWVVVILILAATGVWLIPSQMPMYLGAYSASEGRLFSASQSRRAALGYLVVLLIAATLSVPYWHALGLL